MLKVEKKVKRIEIETIEISTSRFNFHRNGNGWTYQYASDKKFQWFKVDAGSILSMLLEDIAKEEE